MPCRNDMIWTLKNKQHILPGKTANENRPNSKRKVLISGDSAFHRVLHKISEQCLPFIFLITNETLAYVLCIL